MKQRKHTPNPMDVIIAAMLVTQVKFSIFTKPNNP
jgi:hypothetical protein